MKQSDETFTIMVVPHSGKKSTFSISIPIFIIKFLAIILVSVLVVVSIFAVHFSSSYKKASKKAKNSLNKLSSKTKTVEKLQKELDYFIEKTEELEKKMQGIEKLDNDLRSLIEKDPVLKKNFDKSSKLKDSTRIAVSNRGNIDRKKAMKNLEELEYKLPEQEESLKQLKKAIVRRNNLRSQTPTIKPVNGRITSRFGYRKSPFGSRREFHNGLDIAAPLGTPIRATADGVVEFAGYMGGYGKIVTIRHGYGYRTSYGHSSKLLVRVGQTVKKGQTIALVGNTGRSTGPHVHYMVKCNGNLRNPINFITE